MRPIRKVVTLDRFRDQSSARHIVHDTACGVDPMSYLAPESSARKMVTLFEERGISLRGRLVPVPVDASVDVTEVVPGATLSGGGWFGAAC